MHTNNVRLLKFALTYAVVGWQGYGSDTQRAVYKLEELGLLEVSRETKQFRLATTSEDVRAMRARAYPGSADDKRKATGPRRFQGYNDGYARMTGNKNRRSLMPGGRRAGDRKC